MSGRRETTYTISQLADYFKISPRTIRFYEEKFLLAPERSAGNQRIYRSRDRTRLKLILRGKRLGLTLEEIAEILGMADVDLNESEQIRKALSIGRKHLRRIQSQIEELKKLEQEFQHYEQLFLQRISEMK